jgi:hypothetical protein
MALPSYQMQQQLRMEELLASYAAPKEVIEASVGGLAAIKALFTESAEITNWAHASGFLGKLESGKLEFPEVTVESGAVWLWEPEGLTANRVIGVEIGADRLRFVKGTLIADKPGAPAMVDAIQKKWAAQLERCDREYAEAQARRRQDTIRRNMKTADALGLTSISFS